MKPFPNLCRLSEQDREGMAPGQRYAAMAGCPEKYLYLTRRDYLISDSYIIHKFQDLQVRHPSGAFDNVEVARQKASCVPFVESLFKRTGSITVINGYPALSETYLLFWHFVCHFATVKLDKPIQNRESALSFIGNFRLQEEHYQCSRNHNIAIGPILDETNDYQLTGYVDTLMRYDDFNKILLVSSKDVTALLERLRLVPRDVNYFFNLSEKPDPKTKKARKKMAEAL